MAFTTEQQARIDEANRLLLNAQNAYDSAYSQASEAYNKLKNCVDGGGNGRPLEGSSLPSFGNTGNTNDCRIKGLACRTDCCSKDTCISNMNNYNSKIGVYKTASNNLDSAKSNLKTVLDAIAEETANDPQAQQELQQIHEQALQEGMTKRTKIIWISITIIVVIIFGFLIIRKLRG